MNVTIISEIGINHNGKLEDAIDLIYASKDAGVDAVKFQKRDLNQIYSDSILKNPNNAEWNFDYLLPLLSEVELSFNDFEIIKKKCDELNLDLIVTPMDEKSASFIHQLGIAAIKIASADMTNLALIEHCATFELPYYISTGMWNKEDIVKCVEFYKEIEINFSLMLANSTYPTPFESISLTFLKELALLSKRYGYSGHERGDFIPVAAVAMGATIVEKHITLDRSQKGPDHKASLLPEEFKEMVRKIRATELALSQDKHINQQETLSKELFSKSATAKKKIFAGHKLTLNDIIYKAPGKGIFPHEIKDFLNKTVQNDVDEGQFISEQDFDKSIKISEWKKFVFKNKWGVKCRFHDYHDYNVLNAPVIEFHCSQNDLDSEFQEENYSSELIVHAPEIMNRQLVNICSENQKIVDDSLFIIERSINKTLEISKRWPSRKPKMVVHLGGMSLDLLEPTKYGIEGLSTHEKMLEIAIYNFNKLDYPKDEIDVLPENLPPRPWYLGGQWYQYGFAPAVDMVRFCEATKTKMTFDICHAQLQCNLEKSSLADYAKKVKGFVSHLHISDAAGLSAEGIPIFSGDIDFCSVFKVLQDIEYTWVTEIWSGHLHNGAGTYKAMLELESNYRELI